MTTAQITLESAQFNFISQEAKKLNVSISDLIASIVEQYIHEHSRRNNENRSQDFMSIVGLGDSGSTHISEQHDQYLGEALSNEHLR